MLAAFRSREAWAVACVHQMVLRDIEPYPGLCLLAAVLRGPILRYLHRWFQGDQEAAIEAWNDTLFRIHSRVESFDSEKKSFVGWCYDQARYAALDLLRGMKRERSLPIGELPDMRDPLSDDFPEPLTGRQERSLQAAWRRLTSTEQKLLRLRYVMGHSNREIADAVMPGREEHVRVYVNRALRRLRRFFEEETDGN